MSRLQKLVLWTALLLPVLMYGLQFVRQQILVNTAGAPLSSHCPHCGRVGHRVVDGHVYCLQCEQPVRRATSEELPRTRRTIGAEADRQ